jgi:DNA replication licensing factor MCM4
LHDTSTFVLTAANPIGEHDTESPIVVNIDLPPTLISWFDSLYLVLDGWMKGWLGSWLGFFGLYLEDVPRGEGEDVLVRTSLSKRGI